MKILSTLILLFVATTCVRAQPTRAETNATDLAKEHATESLNLANDEVGRFTYFIAGDAERELTLHPKPIYRHVGPQLGEVYTNVFIWSRNGRPEAIASISNWYRPRRYLGLAVTSLSREKLIGMRDGDEIWHPKNAGIALKPVPDAKEPTASSTQRLTQMRAMAREFTAEFKRIARYPEGGKLRLLSRPLYRYESTDAELIDGSLFGIANGTAPQLVLLIEARKTATGSRWEYAIAPRNSTEFHVWHKGREVWSLPQLAPPWPNSKDPTNTYSVFPDLQREGRTQEFVDRLLKFDPEH